MTRRTRSICVLAATISVACATPMPIDKQTSIDGSLLYGFVNLAPSAALTDRARRASDVQDQCRRLPELWCTDRGRFDFISLLLMNSYTGGLRAVGTFATAETKVKRGDIVVVRFRAGSTAEFVRIASRGESENCRWDGGGIGRALTSGGVVCEDYDWRKYRHMFYP